VPKLILASASSRRKSLLSQVGITPDVIVASDIDETPQRHESPLAYVERMAEEKALFVQNDHAEEVVLAADTAVVCGRRILPKAETEEDVRQCLKILSGRQHQVLTSLCVLFKEKTCLKVVQTRIKFKRLTHLEIDQYIANGEGIGKAGGYAIQGSAARFVKQLNGSYSSVVGLPLYEVVSALNGVGYEC
jgi:septum formation protein